MNTSTDGEWMRVEDALAFLGMSHADAIDAIRSRAYNGLIKAKAKQYIDGTGRRFGNVELPPEFWWSAREIDGNWRTGDLTTTSPDSSARLQAFGVTFRRLDIEEMISPVPQGASGASLSSTQTRAGSKVTTPTEGEWMSAYEARQFLHPQTAAARAICSRAHAGLIKARAKLFVSQGEEQTDVDVPREFWWAKGGAALRANWATGDFETVVRSRVGSVRTDRRYQAFGVTFRRSDIEQLKPAPEPATRQKFAFDPPLRSMPTEPKKPLIFISYAHADEPERPAEGEIQWLTFVTGYLRPAMKRGAVDLWLDRLIPGGANWEREIEPKLRACDIFILLVSRHSLSSDYVVDKEVALIRDRQTKGEDVHFYPLVLTPTPKIALDLVRDVNLRPRDGKPLSDYSINDRYRPMSDAADEIVAIAEEIAASRNVRDRAETAQPPTAKTPTRLRLSTGEEKPFCSVQSKMHGRQRTYYIRIENADDEKHVTDVKLTIRGIEPQNEYVGPWEIDSGFALAAGDYKFVPLVQYGEANSTGYSTSAYSRSDTFFVFLTKGGVGHQPTGPKAIPQTILIRATGIGTAPCDYACRVWVQDPDGRLRIASSSASLGTAAAPAEDLQMGNPLAPASDNSIASLMLRFSLRGADSQTVSMLRRALTETLGGNTREAAIVTSVRAGLRVFPLAIEHIVREPGLAPAVPVDTITCALLRTAAISWVSGAYPAISDKLEFAALKAVGALNRCRAQIIALGDDNRVVGINHALSATLSAAIAINRSNNAVDIAVGAAFASVNAVSHIGLALAESVLDEALFDVGAMSARGAVQIATMPLWSASPPKVLGPAWTAVKAGLPISGDWDVWIDWYEERLHGGSRGEDYELVFASVPEEEWDKGPAAANAWIKEHLPKGRDRPPRQDLPEPLTDLDSPFTYDWNASWRVAIVAGAQNLPFFRFGSSEEDHRQTLEACRIGAERLLKDLLEASYGNTVRNEYSKRLEYYLGDLPRAAGTGNILLANDQIVVLRAMLAQDDVVPFPFAADLNRLIAKQTALNDFYDLVRRHEEAVAKGQWTQPFPIEEAKRFFGVVEENTPQLFEPEVGDGLRQVEHAAPPLPLTTEAPPLSSTVQLPPGTTNAGHSRQRQIATAANALWAVFLKGKDLPVALEGWTQAAHKLGENIGPILDFLRGLGGP